MSSEPDFPARVLELADHAERNGGISVQDALRTYAEDGDVEAYDGVIRAIQVDCA
jgi:hypothetical protein